MRLELVESEGEESRGRRGDESFEEGGGVDSGAEGKRREVERRTQFSGHDFADMDVNEKALDAWRAIYQLGKPPSKKEGVMRTRERRKIHPLGIKESFRSSAVNLDFRQSRELAEHPLGRLAVPKGLGPEHDARRPILPSASNDAGRLPTPNDLKLLPRKACAGSLHPRQTSDAAASVPRAPWYEGRS